MQDLKKILFPTDFSRNADRALLQGLRLSGFDCGELIIQHVVRDYFAEHRHFVAMFGIHELQTEMDGYVETHVIPALGSSAKNIRITKVFSKGEPSAEIANLANKEFVDLVLMASADGVFTNAVIRQTHRPVLVASLRGLPEGRSLKKIQRILVATDFSRNSRQVTRYAFALKNLYDSELCMLHVLEAPALPEFVFTRRAADESMNRALDLAGKRLVSMTPDDIHQRSDGHSSRGVRHGQRHNCRCGERDCGRHYDRRRASVRNLPPKARHHDNRRLDQ